MKGGESSMEQTEILLAIQQQLTILQSTIDTLREQSRQKDEEIERLRQIILNLQRAQFGQRSEKRTYVLDDGTQQLSMFDTPEKPEETPAPEPSQNPEKEIRVSGHSRKKKRTLEELCASLPVEERIVDLPDDEKVNVNGHALVCIGQEYVRTELVLERAKAKVVKHYRKVYADRELEQETGYAEVFKPVMPPPLLAHSYASASVVTDVLMKEVCGRHAPVSAGTDVETHGCGAEARHDGELGYPGGGSLSAPLLEADSERAADPEHDSRRRNGDAGAQGERQA